MWRRVWMVNSRLHLDHLSRLGLDEWTRNTLDIYTKPYLSNSYSFSVSLALFSPPPLACPSLIFLTSALDIISLTSHSPLYSVLYIGPSIIVPSFPSSLTRVLFTPSELAYIFLGVCSLQLHQRQQWVIFCAHTQTHTHYEYIEAQIWTDMY